MKITKQELLSAYVNNGTSDVLIINKDNDTLTLRLRQSDTDYDDFKNIIGWLEEITFVGHNELRLNPGSSLTGKIHLDNVSSDVAKLNIGHSSLGVTKIIGRGSVELTNARIQAATIISNAGDDVTTIKDSEIIKVDVGASKIANSSLVCKDIVGSSLKVHNSDICHSVIYANGGEILDKAIRSIVVDTDLFEGKYLSIGFNGCQIVCYTNKNEKIVVVGDKRYNLGLWEEQFVNKEQNSFIKMVNQKKLEMMNMFFDSLAFK
ncbi:hypothetical protein PQB86_gp098 [Klebsiella phage Miami]|uniref:Uncharacterized protein n=1 Tax=Klebsiella phage Miami TaxID=2767581 RepID=A0A873WFV3_9CAUD|nr:hypothetical protein PQB86_gp098 [Klebsiella phage Miami]QPB09193.1 hypothetical protein CPT_Miami_098 [Klebsiella phage Miami]